MSKRKYSERLFENMIPYILILSLFFFGWFLIRPKYTSITIEATVPSYTPDHVFIIGNLQELGQWKEHKHQLTRIRENLYQTEIRVPQGTFIEFKLSLGDWNHVQKGLRFEETLNFSLVADRSKKFPIQIQNFCGYESEAFTHTRTGRFDFLPNFESKILKNQRTIIIYLPPSYQNEPEKQYPVLYMHDGNNLFDSSTAFMGVEWEVDETAQKLIEKNLMEEIIIVGIYNTMGRNEEYTPIRCARHGGGKGNEYLDFIVQELMPVINQKYRTKKGAANTGIMGSSLGGLISLYAGFAYSEHFGKIGAISPSLWWAGNYMEKEWIPSAKTPDIKLWMDIGTKEGVNAKGESQALRDTRNMDRLLKDLKKIKPENYFYFEHENATHDEASWARRIHMPLLFLFGKQGSEIHLDLP